MPRGPNQERLVRNALRLIVGIAVSLGCLYFATRGTDWARVGEVLAGARPLWVLGVMVAGLAAIYIRAQRWRVLLRPLGDVALYPALSATAIGFGASAVLPFRLGELLRPAILGRRAGVGMSAALSSVVLERLLDVLLIIGCFLGFSLAHPMPLALRRGAYGLAALAVFALVALVFLQRSRTRAEAIVRAVLDWVPPRIKRGLAPVAASFVEGLDGLSDLPTVLLVVGYSVYLWGVIALSFLFGFLALSLDVPLVTASLATVVIVAAFVFLPQAPGFVGTWQAGCVLALGLFGVPKDAAFGFSLLTWVAQMVVSLGTAGFFLAREDFSLGQLLRAVGRDAPSAGVDR